MSKAARSQVLAAGGIVLHPGPEPLVAIVKRRKDNGWVLPKGKLAAGERPIVGARREAVEETGHEVAVHEFLGVVTYPIRDGVKLAQFWRMVALDRPPRTLARDIRTMEWVSLVEAIERLRLPPEQLFLDGLRAHLLAMHEAGVDPAPISPAPSPEKSPRVPATGLLRRLVGLWRGP